MNCRSLYQARVLLALVLPALCWGCGTAFRASPALFGKGEPARPRKLTVFEVQIPPSGRLPGLIGAEQRRRIVRGDTLLDVARDAGLGFMEVKHANPATDEWLPPVGADVVVPSRWVLPRSRSRGMVINIPEMRLYLFPRHTRPGDRVPVRTWPIGIGRDEAPSPVGTFHIRAKDKHPTWHVPDSIYQTMDPPRRRVVPPGPDNPMGEYRLRLDKGLYSIHGTNNPWSIGRQTTHGCIRMYPEDIEQLYALVPVGFTGELLYQPVKLGEEGGRIYVEVHADVYGRMRNLERHALDLVQRAGLSRRIDRERLRAAVRAQLGVPVDVTLASAPPVLEARRAGGRWFSLPFEKGGHGGIDPDRSPSIPADCRRPARQHRARC